MAPEGQKPMTFCGFEIKKGPVMVKLWSLRSLCGGADQATWHQKDKAYANVELFGDS